MITAAFETVTPEKAKEYLARNFNNRPINRDHLRFLCEEILLGKWEKVGQGLSFDVDENVLDGQHRLMASVMTKRPIDVLITRGLPPEARDVIDKGKVRYLAHDLRMKGEKYASTRPSTLRFCVSFLQSEKNPDVIRRLPTIKTIGAYDRFMPLFGDAISEIVSALSAGGLSRVLRPACIQSAFVMFYPKDPALVLSLFKKLGHGTNIVEGEPIGVLRNMLLAHEGRYSAKDGTLCFKKVIRAIHAQMHGETLAHLRPNEESMEEVYRINRHIRDELLKMQYEREQLLGELNLRRN